MKKDRIIHYLLCLLAVSPLLAFVFVVWLDIKQNNLNSFECESKGGVMVYKSCVKQSVIIEISK